MKAPNTNLNSQVLCVQKTPLGFFPEEFNIYDFEQQIKLLREEKHQLLEGLTVEFIAQKYIETIASSTDLKILDAVVLITLSFDTNGNTQYGSFTWKRNSENIEQLIKVLQNLDTNCDKTTYICKEDNYKFYITKPNNSTWKPLQTYLRNRRNLTIEEITFPKTNSNSKNINRQESSIRGKLEQAFQNNFIKDVLLPRIFKNYLVQPFFQVAWDLDRIFTYKNNLWEFELKHKYPIDNYDFYLNIGRPNDSRCLCFGINKGQANLTAMLAKQGMNTLHLILVKPRWSDSLDPGYMFIDDDAKEKTLIIGTVLDLDKIKTIITDTKDAPTKTSFSGSKKAPYYQIPRSFFHVIGHYSDSRNILAPKIQALMDGKLNSPLTTEILLNNCLERKTHTQKNEQYT